MSALPYLEHLEHETAILQRLAASGGALPIGGHPADEVLWTVLVEQWRAAHVLMLQIIDATGAAAIDPPEAPVDRAGLLDAYERAGILLQSTLLGADPAGPCWLEGEAPRRATVRQLLRHITHRTLVARLSAETLLAVAAEPIDPALAGDLIDLLAEQRPYASRGLRLHASDLGATWHVADARDEDVTAPADSLLRLLLNAPENRRH